MVVLHPQHLQEEAEDLEELSLSQHFGFEVMGLFLYKEVLEPKEIQAETIWQEERGLEVDLNFSGIDGTKFHLIILVIVNTCHYSAKTILLCLDTEETVR